MAILKVTAVPDFQELYNKINGLSKRTIKINVDSSATESAARSVKKVAQSTDEATESTLHYNQAVDVLLKAKSKAGVELERAAEKQKKADEKAAEAAVKSAHKIEKQMQKEADAYKKAQAAAEQYLRTVESRSAGQSYSPTAIQQRIEYSTGISGLSGKSAASSAAVFEKAFSDIDEKAKKAANSIKEAGTFTDLMGDSFLRIAAKMYIWQVLGNVISGVRRAFYDALDAMKSVDDELVTVRKVTGATSEELEQIEDQAYKTASAYGVAADEYLRSVSAFARAGYKEIASDLAELSTKKKTVGDVEAETANQFLISVDAAYKYKGSIEALSKVLDGANEIDNKYATSIEKISEGLGIVAPVAAQVHVGINELTAAIGTVTAVTQRSGSEAARALRALFLNIVGDTKTEIDEGVTWTTGEIEGLREVVRLYASDAYEAAEATGSVINPMEAIAGLAQSMKEGLLTEQELVQMVSDIGGKLRTSQLLALIQNWDMYQSMLQDYAGAIGSADKEVENALDSWTRKENQLKNAWTEFVHNFADTSLIKGTIDLLTDGLEHMNRLMDGSGVGYYNRRMEYMLDEEHGSGMSVAEKSLELLKANIELGKSAEEIAKQFEKDREQIRQYSEEVDRNGDLVYELIDADREFAAIYDNYVSPAIRAAEQALREEEIAQKQLQISAATDAVSACNIIVDGETEKLAAINMTTAAVYDQVNALALLAHKEYVARRLADSNGGDTLSEIERSWNASSEGQYWGNAIITAGRAREQSSAGRTGISTGSTGASSVSAGGSSSGWTSSGGSSSKSTSTKSKADILRDKMNDALADEKKLRDNRISAIDEEIDALKGEYNLEKQSTDLEEKKLEILKRQNDLRNAQQERTIRLYNAQKGQWEWVADETKVQSAEDALEKARQDLSDYKAKIALDAAVQELEDRKDAINAAYDLLKAEWEDRIDAVEDGTERMGNILSDINGELDGFLNALQEAEQVEEEEVQQKKRSYSVSYSTGKAPTGDKAARIEKYLDQREKESDEIISSWVNVDSIGFDSGGVLKGIGGIKATPKDEIVIPPNIAGKMLTPKADSMFRARMNELGYMYGAVSSAPATLLSGGIGSITNNNGSTYNLGGISIGEREAKTTTVYELAQLAHGLRIYS